MGLIDDKLFPILDAFSDYLLLFIALFGLGIVVATLINEIKGK